MAKSRIQINRSTVPQQRPPAGVRDPGELYVNFADRQLGVMDVAKAPVDLIAIRFFTETASYLVDDVVLRNGYAYRAITPSPPGPFVPANWQIMGALIEAPTDGSSYVRKDGDWVKLLDVDGAASNLDADLLDGQQGAYYLDYANQTGKPATYPPTLPIPSSGVTGLDAKQASQDAAIAAIDWSTLGGKPATFPPTLPIAQSGVTNLTTDLALKAPLASPVFTGNPTAPTPPINDNDTSIATTAYVQGEIADRLTDAPSDGLVYGRKNANWSTVIGGAHTDDSPPPAPLQDGQLWWKSSSGDLYIWYDDGNSQQWVQLTGTLSSPILPDRIVSTPADMWAGFRASGSFAVNTKVDGSGTDVLLVSGAGTTSMSLLSLDDTANSGPWFRFYRRSPSPAANDVLGAMGFVGRDSAGADAEYAGIYATILDPLSTSKDGSLVFRTVTANTATIQLTLADRVEFNQGRIRGNASGSLFLDGQSNALLFLNKSASGQMSYVMGQTNNQHRWLIQLGDATAESGSNTGSNFAISRYSDASVSLGSVMTANRNTGAVNFPTATSFSARVDFELDAVGVKGMTLMDTNGWQSLNASPCLLGINFTGPGTNYGIVTRGIVGGTQTHHYFWYYNTTIGTIQCTGAATVYNTTSDIRTKANSRGATGADARKLVDNIEVIVFDPVEPLDPPEGHRHARDLDTIEDVSPPDDIVFMSIPAQQAYTVYPQAVSPPDTKMEGYNPDAKFGEEGFRPWMLDYSKFVPMLMANTQDNNARLDALEARLATLEAA